MNPSVTEPRPEASRSSSTRKETIFKYDPNCRMLPQLSADAIGNIPGVFDVQVDSACKKLRVTYDGKPETTQRLGEYLNSCRRNPRCGADHSCMQTSHPHRKLL